MPMPRLNPCTVPWKRSLDGGAFRKATIENITLPPEGIRKAIKDIGEQVKVVAEAHASYVTDGGVSREEIARLVKQLETEMRKAAKNLDFERAALLRDRIIDLRKNLDQPLVYEH